MNEVCCYHTEFSKWTQLIKKLNNFARIEDTCKLFEVKSVTPHQIFFRVNRSRYVSPLRGGRGPTDIKSLSYRRLEKTTH
jgi:hypothetical protein